MGSSSFTNRNSLATVSRTLGLAATTAMRDAKRTHRERQRERQVTHLSTTDSLTAGAACSCIRPLSPRVCACALTCCALTASGHCSLSLSLAVSAPPSLAAT